MAMESITFQVPWPPSYLSPNARAHWAVVYRIKSKYRDACWATVMAQSLPAIDPDGDYRLTMRFVPPDRRSYDRDNLVARMKSGIDGIADALLIDDKRFTELTASVSADSVGGFVEVRIQPISQGASNEPEAV